MKILVTGSSGFIGTNLCGLLESNGVEVVRIDIKHWPRCDAGLHYDLLPRMEGCDGVVHLAANPGIHYSIAHPRESFEYNAGMTDNVLECARELNVDRVVLASSVGAPQCRNPYAASKVALEALACAYTHSYGLNTVCLRFTNVYGPFSREKPSVVATFLRAIETGVSPVINGNGLQVRDYIYVADVCDAIFLALNQGIEGHHVFEIGTGIGTTVIGLANTICNIVGRVPFVMGGPVSSGEVDTSVARTDHAQRVLGFRSRVKLHAGIERTLAWWQNSHSRTDAGLVAKLTQQKGDA